jgi:uncharacterized protein YrrD
MRSSAVVGLPVVTLAGESPFEIKDVVFDRSEGAIVGFTLRKHGFLGGPVDQVVDGADLLALGPDAAVVADDRSLRVPTSPLGGDGEPVIGDRVLSRSGTDLGTVVELIIEGGPRPEVVGMEVAPTDALVAPEGRAFLPLPHSGAISADNVVVPDGTSAHARPDLRGFAQVVHTFRHELEGEPA